MNLREIAFNAKLLFVSLALMGVRADAHAERRDRVALGSRLVELGLKGKR